MATISPFWPGKMQRYAGHLQSTADDRVKYPQTRRHTMYIRRESLKGSLATFTKNVYEQLFMAVSLVSPI